jgi:glucose/arabinose dehydrogenase
MKHPRASLLAAALLLLALPLQAAIQLAPVASGLSSPLFVGHAGDGSNRLFIVERGGLIKVLQPGESVPTNFLNLDPQVLSGGERGLLGLAFHPDYETNGRFYVFYTRDGATAADDGDLVIAEYTVSADPNVANTTEHVLLTIEHSSQGNHNGGNLSFGADGHLYANIGDGGGANDTPNNAQNINTLLGKILRLDVGPPHALGSYSSPADNPYVGVAGLDEIYSLGWRNPWRSSFDRSTGQMWIGDVGQDAWEEIDSPIVKGGNYGWRVFEGTHCTGLGPAACTPSNYVAPIYEYPQSLGRCSVTGGYVYRGTLNTLTPGTYIYADYCTGEILTGGTPGSAPTVLLDTTGNLSSFGEDEQGELYVTHLSAGTVSKIVSTTPCTFDIDPTSQSFPSGGGTGNVAVTAGAGCDWTAVANQSWIHVTSGAGGEGNGNVGFSVDANTSQSARNGSLTIAGHTFSVSQAAAPAPTNTPTPTPTPTPPAATPTPTRTPTTPPPATPTPTRTPTTPPPACTYSIAPTQASFPKAGGNGSVAVTAGAGCGWTAVSNASWITITGGSNGSGNGTVTYSVAVYTGKPKKRNGTMTIAGATFAVQQTK